MTMTTKEKRLANTDIEISQHALVTFKLLTEFVAFRLARKMSQKERHSSVMFLFAVLNNFIYFRNFFALFGSIIFLILYVRIKFYICTLYYLPIVLLCLFYSYLSK